MKRFKIFLIFTLSLLMITSVLAFSGCGKKFTVTFDANGGYLVYGEKVQTVSKASKLEEPVFAKDGYAFVGWDVDVSTIKKTTTVQAQWKVAEYSIIYVLGEGETLTEANPSKYTYFSDTIILNPAKKMGYNFTGWTGTDLNSKTLSVIIPQGSFGNRIYTPTWEVIKYGITYELNGGSFKLPNPFEYTVNTPATTINNPERDGYDFVGWTGMDLTEPTTNLTIGNKQTEDRHYVANWVPKTYHMNFVDADGTSLEYPDFEVRYTCEVGESQLLPVPQKTGYVFEGWYYGEQKITEKTVYNFKHDVTLTAHYVEAYTIKFALVYDFKGVDPDGDYVEHPILFVYNHSETPPSAVQVELGGKLSNIPAVTVHPMYGSSDEYKFLGWVYYTATGEEKAFTKNTVVDTTLFPYSEIVLYPKGGYAFGPTITD